MNNAPLITIGITSYNAEKSIEGAVRSAFSQDWPNIEVIAVDDCSSDSSYDVLLNLKKEYPDFIVYRSEKNGGVSASRNRILEMAKGEYLAFFDDDDESQTQRIKEQYEAIVAYQKIHGTNKVCCFCSIRKFYPNGYNIALEAIGSSPKVPVGKDMVDYQLFINRAPDVFYGSGTPSCALMTRTSLLKEAGGYDENLKRNEDTDISIRLGMLDTHFIGVKAELVRQHASGGADKRPEIGYESENNIVEKYRTILESQNKYGFARDWVRMRFYHFSNKKIRLAFLAIAMLIKYPRETFSRLLKAAPARLIHERKMSVNKS